MTITVTGATAGMRQAGSDGERTTLLRRVKWQSTSVVSVWIGRSISALVTAFLLLASALPKFLLPELAEESMNQLGWSPKHLVVIAMLELLSTVLYATPRTALLGAVLLTALLGGAVATHLRVENPLMSHTLFPIYVALLAWCGLWLRRPELRAFVRDWLTGHRGIAERPKSDVQ